MDAPAGAGDSGVDRNVERTAPNASGGLKADDVVLAEDRLDGAEMGVPLLVAEPHLLAVREEDVGHLQLIGVAAPLRLAAAQGYAGALGFEHSESAPKPVKQDIIGFSAVIERVLVADASSVGRAPSGIPEKLVILTRAKASFVIQTAKNFFSQCNP
jgi:hypothetical protein